MRRLYNIIFKVKSKVIIRICVGVVLPKNAKLIGNGTYLLLVNGRKMDEPYYDYEIKEKYMESFLTQNNDLLVEYQLIDPEPTNIDLTEKNPVKDPSLRGWAKAEEAKIKN